MKKNGIISTTTPVKNGSAGGNASKTFYWTSDPNPYIIAPTFNIVEIDGAEDDISIGNMYGAGVSPSVDDQIVYSESGKTRTFIITKVFESNVHVKTLGLWNAPIPNVVPDDYSDLDVNVTFEAVNLDEYFEPDEQGDNKLEANLYRKSSDILLNTVVTSNGRKLGKTKVTLEFYSPLSSPAMDTMLLNFFDVYNTQPVTRVDDGDSTYTETYRGYVNTYSRVPRTYKAYYEGTSNPKVALTNFDNEKVDNFVILVKDFDESADNTVHVAQTTLNRNLLKIKYLDELRYPYFVLIITDKSNDGHISIHIPNDTIDITFYNDDTIPEIIYRIASEEYDGYNVVVLSDNSVLFTALTGSADVSIGLSDPYTITYETSSKYQLGNIKYQKEGSSGYDTYRCFAYIYIPDLNKDYTKHLIGEINLSELILA